MRGLRRPETQARVVAAFLRSDVDVLCLQETWLSKDCLETFPKSPEFRLLTSPPKQARGEGVAILVKRSMANC